MTITISIQDSTWEKLNKRKKAGDSFDDVINKALNEIPENKKEETKNESNT